MNVGHEHVVDVRGDDPVAALVPSALSWNVAAPRRCRASADLGAARHRRRRSSRLCRRRGDHPGHQREHEPTREGQPPAGFILMGCPPCAVGDGQPPCWVYAVGFAGPYPRLGRPATIDARCVSLARRPSWPSLCSPPARSPATRSEHRSPRPAPRPRRDEPPSRHADPGRNRGFRWRSSPASRTSSPSSPSTSWLRSRTVASC